MPEELRKTLPRRRCIAYSISLVFAVATGLFASLFHYVEPRVDLATWRFFTKQMSRRMIVERQAWLYIGIVVLLAVVLILLDHIMTLYKIPSVKNPVRYAAVCILLLLGGWYLFLTVSNYQREKQIMTIREDIRKERTVIHAGGFIAGSSGVRYDYTNSLDALENSYNLGNHYCEVDFDLTMDGYLVCSHGEGTSEPETVTREQFLQEKAFREFRTMDLEMLADFMRQHEDLYVVTDCKTDNETGCARIRDVCPDLLDRFIVQIYHADEYNVVSKMGFQNIIYTLYRTRPYERVPQMVVDSSQKYDLVGITFWSDWADDEKFLKPLLKSDIPLLVHTVNETDVMLYRYWQGISAIYTDLVENEEFRQ